MACCAVLELYTVIRIQFACYHQYAVLPGWQGCYCACACRVLELLSRFLGSHPEAQLLYARTLFLNGAMDAAARKAATILGNNQRSTQAALLVVDIHLRQGRAGEAMAALEAAVSANFAIRDAPLYHVVHAQVLLANGQLEEARKVGIRQWPAAATAASTKPHAGNSLLAVLAVSLLCAEVVRHIGFEWGRGWPMQFVPFAAAQHEA